MASIYILWTCDEWKSRDSMRVRMASTLEWKINESIFRGIKESDFDYAKTSGEVSREDMGEGFLHDIREGKSFSDINVALRYGMVEEFEDGEEN